VDIAFKIRHTEGHQQGTLHRQADGTFLIESRTPLQGIAPGQFGVLYDKDFQICAGSGEIFI
jgi:tRNA-specific 2-thiouridylase